MLAEGPGSGFCEEVVIFVCRDVRSGGPGVSFRGLRYGKYRPFYAAWLVPHAQQAPSVSGGDEREAEAPGSGVVCLASGARLGETV